MSNKEITAPLLPALEELKNAVNALDASQSYAEMLPQFEHVTVALVRAKTEKAFLENASKPIFSLPPEITSHIFKIYREMYQAMQIEDDIFPSLELSHVSCAWREIAISTPTLWNTLNTDSCRSYWFYEMLVERSKTSLLDVFIRIEPYEQHDGCATMLMELALPHAYRWRFLQIIGPSAFVHNFAIPQLRELTTPHLKHLEIADSTSRTRGSDSVTRTDYHILTGGAERLSTFISGSIGWHACRPPLAALTSFTFVADYPISYSAFCEALVKVSSTLIHISLSGSFVLAEDPIRGITMPFLLELEVKSNRFDGKQIFVVLATIEAPSLLDIAIFPGESLPWPRFLSMVATLGTTPRYPCLTTLRIAGKLGGGILVPFPTITTLFIMDHPSQENYIEDLLDLDQDSFSQLVPHLSHVTFPQQYIREVRTFVAARFDLGLAAPILVYTPFRGPRSLW